MRFAAVFLVFIAFSCHKPTQTTKSSGLLLKTALKYKGTPYKYGGEDRKGMDCSGLVFRSFADLGVQIPRISYQQAEHFFEIKESNIQVGDLVYFKIGKTNKINHTGIVSKLVNKEIVLFLHSSSSAGVREDNLYSNYWKPKFVKAARPKF